MPLYLIITPKGEKYVSRFRSEDECRKWALNAFGSGCSVELDKIFNKHTGPHPFEAELGDTVRELAKSIKI